MKKALFIVLAILVMVTMVVAQDSATPPTPGPKNTTWFNADGDAGHISHGCMLCHAPHSANATISSAAVTPVGGTFNANQYPTGYTGTTPPSPLYTGFSGGPVAGSIYLWGTAITNQTYTTWEGTTISKANIVNKNSAVVHTLLCMSCHDNANSSYLMGLGYGKPVGTELGTGNPVTDAYGDHIGLSQINTTGTAWNSSSSLANSHPVDIQYTSGGYNWLINADGTFQDKTFQLTSALTGHPAKLWVDGVSGNAMVECTSCHDPHRETVFAYWNGTNYTIGAAGSTIFYLRGPYTNPESGNGNTNANFCRSCHYSKSAAYQTALGAAK